MIRLDQKSEAFSKTESTTRPIRLFITSFIDLTFNANTV